MLISSFSERSEITAVDGCRLRELLHPERVARVSPPWRIEDDRRA